MDDYKRPIDDADFKAIFHRLEHLDYEIHKVKEQLKEAATAEEESRLENKYDRLLGEFFDIFHDVKTFAQHDYLMRNLPVYWKPQNAKQKKQGERQLGWHRTLANIWEQPEPFQAIYGWLEFQYMECETLKGQITTATLKELPVLESQLAAVSAEYLELANKIITNGCRHGIPIEKEAVR